MSGNYSGPPATGGGGGGGGAQPIPEYYIGNSRAVPGEDFLFAFGTVGHVPADALGEAGDWVDDTADPAVWNPDEPSWMMLTAGHLYLLSGSVVFDGTVPVSRTVAISTGGGLALLGPDILDAGRAISTTLPLNVVAQTALGVDGIMVAVTLIIRCVDEGQDLGSVSSRIAVVDLGSIT